ncbi:MAG: LysR family transcriptional regulator [Clostridia bacterium]|nr:LysR family transcriptional regulator [Clostridia bacterium]
MYDPHLDVFLRVAELGSFSKAAAAGFITPSAVIKQINLLESDLGVRLFERTHRGLKLTKAGESLKADAPEIIKKSMEAAHNAVLAMEHETDIIRIGTSPMTPAWVLIELWPKLSVLLPKLKFQLVPFDNTPQNARMILKNLGENIDVVSGIFDERLLDYRECSGIELSREKLCVAFSVNHPLAAKKRLSLKDLYGEELMMLAPGSMGCMDELREYLKSRHPQIKIIDFPLYNTGVFNECENKGRLLITVERWKTVHPLLKTVRMGWKYDMSYGLLYSRSPDRKVTQFLNAIKEIT